MARAKSHSRTVIEGDAFSGAEFDAARVYRYRLWRRWESGPGVCFIMLNPSTADATADDPTIRRCTRFARDWGFAALDVVNLFAYRATEPHALRTTVDPVGPLNEEVIAHATAGASLVVAAWGAWPALPALATNARLHCLARNRDGSPRHPLYVRADATPVLYAPG